MATYVIYAGTADGWVQSLGSTYADARAGSFLSADSTATTGQVGQYYNSGAASYEVYELFLSFANPTLAPTEEMVSASLGLVVNTDNSTTDFTMEARLRDWGSSLGTASWVAGASLADYTLLGQVSSKSIAVAPTYANMALSTATVAASTAYLMLASSRARTNVQPTGMEYLVLRTSDYTGTTADPKLTYVTQDRPWRLIVNGANRTSLADISALRITDTGTGAVGRLEATLANPLGTADVYSGSVLLTDTYAATKWQGSIISRRYEPLGGGGNSIGIEAVDYSAGLDRVLVSSTAIAEGTSDQSAVLALVSAYGSAVGITASTATVAQTRDYLSPAISINGQSLRAALQLVADASISIDPSGVEWTPRTLPLAQYYTGIAYGTAGWLSVGVTGGTVIKSSDSYTWSTAATSIYASSLDYANGLYVAGGGAYVISSGTAARIYWTTNGTSWSSATAGYVFPDDYTNVVGADGPVDWWRFGDTTGSIATAVVGTNGTYVASPTLGTAGAIATDSNKAVYFNGSTQYMKVQTGDITGSWTFEAWSKVADTAGTYCLVSGRAKENTFDLKFQGGTKLHGDIGNGTSWISTAADSTFSYAANTWYHVAFVAEPTKWTTYLNGTAIGSATYASNTPQFSASGYDVTIGQSNVSGSNEWFKGSIDEPAVYDYALSSATVAAHYKAGTATRHGATSWLGSAYGSAGWVSVGQDTASGYVTVSASGTSWPSGVAYDFNGPPLLWDVTYAGGTYVAVGATAILTSTNGTAWSTATTSPTLGTALLGVGTDGTAVVAVGSSGAIYHATTPGGTYTQRTAPAAVAMRRVTWWPNAGLWVAVGNSNTTWTSPDAITWTEQTTAEFGILYDVAANGDTILGAGTNMAAVTDGIVGSLVQDTAARTFYVDMSGTLYYGILAGTAAPYAISDAPDGTSSIAAEALEIDYDESDIVNRVFVASAPADWVYGAWVEDATSVLLYGRHEAFLSNENATDAVTAERYGKAYLAARKDPAVRGQFTVTGKDGWAAGQTLTITNTALGLSAQTFQITQVDTEFLTGTGTRRYRVAFGALPKSLVRLLAAS